MLTREFDKSSLPHIITAVTLFNHSLVCDMQAIFFKGDDSVYPTYLLLTSYVTTIMKQKTIGAQNMFLLK